MACVSFLIHNTSLSYYSTTLTKKWSHVRLKYYDFCYLHLVASRILLSHLCVVWIRSHSIRFRWYDDGGFSYCAHLCAFGGPSIKMIAFSFSFLSPPPVFKRRSLKKHNYRLDLFFYIIRDSQHMAQNTLSEGIKKKQLYFFCRKTLVDRIIGNHGTVDKVNCYQYRKRSQKRFCYRNGYRLHH